jgi:FkbM family methyltransferase
VLTRAFAFLRRATGYYWTVHSISGQRLRLDLRPDDGLFKAGDYELPIQRMVEEYLPEGGVFYDVGANLGFFSVLAGRLAGARGAVYAFEPVPGNAARIQKNASLNGLSNVRVVGAAVSDVSGEAELFLAEYGGGSGLASAGKPPDMIGSMRVGTITLDEHARQPGVRMPHLVKIDVEGAELDVLKGMTSLLRTQRPAVIMEFDDPVLSGCERKLATCSALLESHGYRCSPIAAWYPDGAWFVRHLLSVHPNQSSDKHLINSN